MPGTLEGLNVIELGHFQAIPAVGATLADWGAKVTKIEPLSGELQRGLITSHGVPRVIKYKSGEADWLIEVMNRNKKGLAVNLKEQLGRDILYKLVKKADIFISNYEVNALNRLKADYLTLSQINPQLIYAIITGYGTEGPDKNERGFDVSAAWARSGTQYLIGEPGSPPPQQRPGMMDRVASSHVVAGILAALYHRQNTGQGQKLECSLYHAAVWTLATDIQAALVGRPLSKDDRSKASNPLWNTYQTKDKRWLQLVMLQETHWPDFCQALDIPQLENDSRFCTREKRAQNREELITILDQIFSSKDMEEWEKSLKIYNCIFGRVQSAVEAITDPQALSNDFYEEIIHPGAGRFKYVTTPVKFFQNPSSIISSAPEVGQHTEEILIDMGYKWTDIEKLKEQKVIL